MWVMRLWQLQYLKSTMIWHKKNRWIINNKLNSKIKSNKPSTWISRAAVKIWIQKIMLKWTKECQALKLWTGTNIIKIRMAKIHCQHKPKIRMFLNKTKTSNWQRTLNFISNSTLHHKLINNNKMDKESAANISLLLHQFRVNPPKQEARLKFRLITEQALLMTTKLTHTPKINKSNSSRFRTNRQQEEATWYIFKLTTLLQVKCSNKQLLLNKKDRRRSINIKLPLISKISTMLGLHNLFSELWMQAESITLAMAVFIQTHEDLSRTNFKQAARSCLTTKMANQPKSSKRQLTLWLNRLNHNQYFRQFNKLNSSHHILIISNSNSRDWGPKSSKFSELISNKTQTPTKLHQHNLNTSNNNKLKTLLEGQAMSKNKLTYNNLLSLLQVIHSKI